MPYETWVIALACGFALLALIAALLAVRAMRRLRGEVRALQAAAGAGGHRQERTGSNAVRVDGHAAGAVAGADGAVRADGDPAGGELVHAPTPLPYASGVASADGRERQVLPQERAVVTQEGTVIILPSEDQVVAATMGRPLVRGAVLSHGLMHALRPESRDRIRGIVRREFRRRRKLRRRAARQAARSVSVRPDAVSWLGSGDSTGAGETTTSKQEGER